MKPMYPVILAIFLFPKISFSQYPVLPEAMLADAGVGAATEFAPASTNSDLGSASYGDFSVTAKRYQGNIFSAKFVSFDLVQKGNGVLVQWSVTHEHNSKHFEVQRSYNGNDWIVAGTVAATGEFDVVRGYSFLDDHVTKANVFYRIRHIDLDARHSNYTNIQSIKLLSPAETVNIITDSRKNIILNFYSSLNAKATIQVRSMYGEVFIEKATINPTTQVSIAADNLPAGLYVVSVTNNESLVTAKKIILK